MTRADALTTHGTLYTYPFLYDVAFRRNYAAECGFLQYVYQRHCGRPLSRFLELAAGPAGHAIELAASGTRCGALDLSPDMVQYGLQQAHARGAQLDYWVADMTAFSASARYELAACLLDSGSYLFDDAAFDAHLGCVAEALDADGIYLLELAHPSVLSGGAPTKSIWDVATEDGTLHASWESDPSLAVDRPRVCGFRATLHYRGRNGDEQRVESTGFQRAFLYEELDALIAKNGRFRLVETFGGFDPGVSLSAPKAWRMIPVLQKVR
jgi:SAM-dependent methyltransferase